MDEVDEFGIPIKKPVVAKKSVDEFGIPIKKKGSSESTPQEKAGVSPTRPTQQGTSSDTEPPTRAQASVVLGGPTKLFGQEEEKRPTSIMYGNEPKKDGFVPPSTTIDTEQSIKYLEKKTKLKLGQKFDVEEQERNRKELERLKALKKKTPIEEPVDDIFTYQFNSVRDLNNYTSKAKEEVDAEVNNTGFLNVIKSGLSSAYNTVVSGIGKLADLTPQDISAVQIEKNPIAKEISEVKSDPKNSKLTEEEVNFKAYQLAIENKAKSLRNSQTDDYLESVPENVKNNLQFNKVDDLKTIEDNTKKVVKVRDSYLASLENDYIRLYQLQQANQDQNEIANVENRIKSNTEYIKKLDKSIYGLDREHGSAEEEVELLKRNYDMLYNISGRVTQGTLNALVTTGDMIADFILPESENNPEYINRLKKSKDELVTETVNNISELSDTFRKDIKDVNNVNDFINWSSDVFAVQVPNLVAASTGNPGLAVMGATSMAQKRFDMKQEVLNGTAKYDDLQMVSIPLLWGAAEVVSEIPTVSILKKAGLATSAINADDVLKRELTNSTFNNFLRTGKDYSKDQFKENAGELFTNVSQNALNKYFLGKDEVGIFDNSEDILKDTFLMTSMLQSSPHIAGAVIKPFTTPEYTNVLDNNSKQILNLNKLIGDKNVSEEVKSVAKNKIAGLNAESGAIVNKIVSSIDSMSDTGKSRIAKIEKEQSELRAKASEITQDKTVDVNTKKDLLNTLKSQFKLVEDERVNILSGKTTVEEMSVNAPAEVKVEEIKPIEVKEIVAPKEDLTAGKGLFSEPVEDVIKTAENYKKSKGITVDAGERITDIDVENSKKIADAYDEMQSNPNDPEVKAAYNAMANETVDQFKYLIDNGYIVELYDGKTEPYKNSEEMLKDLRDNKHLYVFSTEEGFGDTPITEKDRQENPLLKDSGFTDKNGKKLLINDAFRFVHDIFGHGERGNSFGAKGEENAWDVHSRMYSPEARRAMTTETRGQNSWVNFNKGMRNEDGSIKKKGDEGYLSPTERPFADQKIGLLPEWASESIYETAEKPTEPTKKNTEKAKELADKVRSLDLPDWLKANIEGGKKQGVDADTMKEALAKAIEKTGELMDKGIEFAEAVKEAINDIVNLLGEDKRASIEKDFADYYQSTQKPLEMESKGLDVISKGVANMDDFFNEMSKDKDFNSLTEEQKKDLYYNSVSKYSTSQAIDQAAQAPKLIDLKDQNWLKKFIQAFQNKMIRVKDVQEQMEGALGIKILKEANVALKFELLVGKTINIIEDKQKEIFDKSNKESWANRAKKDGVDIDQLGVYMYALHAEERNLANATEREENFKKEVDALNEKIKNAETQSLKTRYENELKKLISGQGKVKLLKEAGSGMTNEQAQEIIDNVEKSGKKELFDKYASEFRENVIKPALDDKLKYGLIDQELYDKLQTQYKNYVPLQVVEKAMTKRAGGAGAGASVKGRDIFKAKGSDLYKYTDRYNPIFSSMFEYQNTVARGERNQAAQALINLAELDKNNEVFEVHKPKYTAILDSNGDIKYMLPTTSQKLINDSVELKVDGKPVYVEIKDKAMRDALQSQGIQRGIRGLYIVNSWIRSTATLMNPNFLITNFLRDYQSALINIQSEIKDLDIKNVTGQIANPKNLKSAGQGIIQDSKGKYDSEWAKLAKEYRDSGGKVSWFQKETLEEYVDSLRKDIEKINKGEKMYTAALNKLGNTLMLAQSVVEQSVRLSTFKALKDAGVSTEEAARAAKNITVNFENKGTWGGLMDSLYLFATAGLSGTVRMATSLSKSKTARTIAGGMFAYGILEAALNSHLGGDDDDDEKIDDGIKERNFVLVNPKDSKQEPLLLPMAYGLNVFKYAGNLTYDVATGRKDATEATSKMFMTIYNQISPLQGPTLSQAVAPTAFDPFVQQSENKNFFGAPIKPEQPKFGAKKKESDLYFESVRTESLWTAKKLNEWTGGSAMEKGYVDISPEILDHYYDAFGGGTGKFISDVGYTGKIAAKEVVESVHGKEMKDKDEFSLRRLPFVKAFFGSKPEKKQLQYIYETFERSAIDQLTKEEITKFTKQLKEAVKSQALDTQDAKQMYNTVMEGQYKIKKYKGVQEVRPADMTKKEYIKFIKGAK